MQPQHPEHELPPSRRGVLHWLSLVLGALAALAVGLPVVGFFLGPVLKKAPDDWIDLGPADDFPENTTLLKDFPNPHAQPWDGPTAQAAAYVRNQGEGKFQIFAINCAHLGCPVSWFPQSGLFLCPCHGGVYYENGDRASGPPPRGLFTYDYKVEDGRLKIWAGHLPTLQNLPGGPPRRGAAEGKA